MRDDVSLAATRVFGNLADRVEESFSPLKGALLEADMKMLFRTYVSLVFMASTMAFFVGIASVPIVAVLLRLSFQMLVMYVVFMPVAAGGGMFLFGYLYPFSRASSRKKNIELNLPFAINHIAAIAGSGVSADVIFRLLIGFEEYGEIAKEAKKVVQNVDVFGQDITTAMREVSDRTPSKPFKELIEGMLSTIETGGNLQLYLRNQSDKALFDYRLRRERYLEVLSTYADFYTAVMIAAPLFLVAILAILNLIGGELFGLAIPDIMRLGILLVIPLVNIVFLLFVHFTQPEV